ncbi:MAG: hypothetical protein ACRBF0_09815 [Calditrichia bacterium]
MTGTAFCLSAILCFFALFNLGTTAKAQDVLWEEISYSASRLAMLYNDRAEQDSVRLTLRYWLGGLFEAGMIEPLQRFIILHSLQEGRFTEDVFDERIIWFLTEYENKMRLSDELSEAPWYSVHYPIDGVPREIHYLYEGFNHYTQTMAQHALDSLKLSGSAKLLCKIYANRVQDVTKHILDEEYEHSAVREYYDRAVSAVRDQIDFHIGLSVGRWNPGGNLKIVGSHPMAGFTVGAKYRQFMFNLTAISKFRETPSSYLVQTDAGEIVESNHFIGAFMGLELSRELYRRGRNEVEILSGIGLDGFDTIKRNVNGEGGKSIFAFNINGGIGYRYYVPPFQSLYINFQLRYHIVDYNNTGGSDLSGNVITLRFQFGFLGNALKQNRLKRLGFSY